MKKQALGAVLAVPDPTADEAADENEDEADEEDEHKEEEKEENDGDGVNNVNVGNNDISIP